MVEFVSKLVKPVEKKDIRTKGKKRRQKKASSKPRAPLATVRKTPVVRLNPKSSPFQPLGKFRNLQQNLQPNIPPQNLQQTLQPNISPPFHNQSYNQDASINNQVDSQHLESNAASQMDTRLYHNYPNMNNCQARTPMPTLVDHPYSSFNNHSSLAGSSLEKGLMKLTRNARAQYSERPQSLIAHNKKMEVNLLQHYGQKHPAGYRSFSWMQPHTRGEYFTRAPPFYNYQVGAGIV